MPLQTAGAPRVVHDGRFLRIQRVEQERTVTRIDLVLNWFEELKARVAAR